MKKSIFTMVIVCLCAFSVQGQFKMNSNGKMLLGDPYTGNPPGTGQQDAGNVFIGEYPVFYDKKQAFLIFF